MGDRANNDPIQEILDELDRIRTREQELIVQRSGFVQTGIPPAPPRAADPLLSLGYAFASELIHRSNALIRNRVYV